MSTIKVVSAKVAVATETKFTKQLRKEALDSISKLQEILLGKPLSDEQRDNMEKSMRLEDMERLLIRCAEACNRSASHTNVHGDVNSLLTKHFGDI